jgi:hypothetical protein
MKELIPYEHEIAIVEEYKDQEISSWEECVSSGLNMRQLKDDSQWTLGFIALIVDKFYTSAAERIKALSGNLPRSYILFAYEIGIDPETLRLYKGVASGFLSFCGLTIDKLKLENIPERPFPKLSFSHLQSVATIPDDQKKILLTEAEDNNWPRAKIREAVAKFQGRQDPEMKKIIDEDNDDVVFRWTV